MQFVYDIFLRFISSPDFQVSLGKKYIDAEFLNNFMDIFTSEDARERDFVKMILHRIYGKLITLRFYIQKLIINIFLK